MSLNAENTSLNVLHELVYLDEYTSKIENPTLLLITRTGKTIGKIPRYYDWNFSLVGNGIDEISFSVDKYTDGVKCPVWDKLIDFAVVEIENVARYELSVSYTDNEKTTKSIVGQSLEVELDIPIYGLHVNDEEVITADITDINKDDFDEKGDFIPTVLCNKNDKTHSLLHRVLADKAPHWDIGYVTPYVAMDEKSQPQETTSFQREYTVDGDKIYDFLTNDVATEANVVFLFDTVHRLINMYSLCDCIDQETGEVLAKGIGTDTGILISKNKLAQEIGIESNKDSMKNCLRVEGGDEMITNMVKVVNVNSSNYLYQFADFQYEDMGEPLTNALKSYQELIESKQDEYYGEDGIYTKLCDAYDDLYYYESTMMPDTSKVTDIPSIEDQYQTMISELQGVEIGVVSLNHYDSTYFPGITNNITSFASVIVHSKYDVDVIEGTTTYDSSTKIWKGKLKLIDSTDNTNYYPKDESIVDYISFPVTTDELTYTEQKLKKTLSQGNISGVDADMDKCITSEDLYNEFNKYSLNRLNSFVDAYNSCVSVLADMNLSESKAEQDFYAKYQERYNIASKVQELRKKQVEQINSDIDKWTAKQKDFQASCDFKSHLDEIDKKLYNNEEHLYESFCAYRREDTYKNDNYISVGKELDTAALLEIAKNLVDEAKKELKKSCVLQRTVTTTLNNLLALPEFKELHDKFNIFNYIRVRTDDEIFKLRIMKVEFNSSSSSDISVTFSEQIEAIDGTTSDVQSILQQASAISSNFSYTALQAKKGQEVNNEVSSWINDGLSAAQVSLSNNNDNEVTITKAGIICKRMDDEGFYGDKQFRITGNRLYFTSDNWKNVEMAIGEVKINNEYRYGIIADVIVGNLIAGNKLLIGNDDGSVTITSSGIIIKNGTIQSANYSSDEKTGSIINLDDGTFSFGGGDLVYDGKDVTVSGKIVAEKGGTIGAFTLGSGSTGALTNTNGNYTVTLRGVQSNVANGVFYITDKSSGSNVYPFRVNGDGSFFATKATISGNINSSTITGGTLSGSTITGGNINIGNGNFVVDTSGNLTTKGNLNLASGSIVYSGDKLTINGVVNASAFKYEDNDFKVSVSNGISIINKTESIETSYYIKNKFGDYSFLGANSLYLHNANAGTVYLSANDQGHLDCNKPIYMYTNDIYGTDDYVFIVNIADDTPHNLYFGYTSNAVENKELKESTTVLRGKNVKLQAHSGGKVSSSVTIDVPSDENLKNMYDIDERYEEFFMNLTPRLYSYKNIGHRKHVGYGARQVEQALLDVGLTTEEFAGLVIQKDVTLDKDELGLDEDKHFDELYSLRYEEFGALYAHMLQKALKKIDKLEAEINKLKGGVAS